MSALQHLSWDNFQRTVFVKGEQRVHRVSDSPCIDLFGDGVANRLGILLSVPEGASVPPELSKLEFIRTRVFSDGGKTFLEVATSGSSLHRQFYHFLVAVAERVSVEGRPAIDAVRLELACFTDLLVEKSLLGIEQQIGLLGELLFLEHLVARSGPDALEAWLGPLGEPHDFRIGAHEFEVKATVSPHRIHTIHGLEQLVASSACALYLVSILLGPAGGGPGFSLADKVEKLGGRFEPLTGRAEQFTKGLAATGFRSEDAEHYGRRFAMRRPIAIVPVDDAFPAITRPGIQQLLGPLATRVTSVNYDVSVDGMEHESGTAAFENALRA